MDGTEFEIANGPDGKGHTYAILSEKNHLINAFVDRVPGPNAWPEWCARLGLGGIINQPHKH